MSQNSIKITVFPALNGDSILLELADKIFLIDGGYINTFNQYLLGVLKKKSEEGKTISHLIVTHIDRDHIYGIVRLLEKNTNNEIITIENIWHNSYRHIKDLEEKYSQIVFDGKTDLTSLCEKSYLKEFIEGSQEVSAEKGSTLGALILKRGYKWNFEFANKAVSIDNLDTIQLDKNNTIRILSPDNKKLSKLKRFWNTELYKKGYKILEGDTNYDDAFEFLIAQEKEKKIFINKNISKGKIDIDKLSQAEFPEDNSVSNGSSISFVLESSGKKLLFLADSHPTLIIESLKKHYSDADFPIKFDIVKLSHHGCVSNTSNDLLKLIDSTNFIISTNGNTFGHPNIETIARIVNRKSDFIRNIYFNYTPIFINEIENRSLKDKYTFEICLPIRETPLEINLL